MANIYQTHADAQYRSRPSNNKGIAFLPLWLTLVGTAGVLTPQAMARSAEFSPTPLIRTVGRSSKERRLQTVAQQIAFMRETLGFKITELAEVFGVSRTAVYDWINGTAPKPEIVAKINGLSSFAAAVRHAGIDKLPAITSRVVYRGKTLLEMAKTGEDLDLAMPGLQEAYGRDQQMRGLMDEIHARPGNLDGSADEIITPIVIESA